MYSIFLQNIEFLIASCFFKDKPNITLIKKYLKFIFDEYIGNNKWVTC